MVIPWFVHLYAGIKLDVRMREKFFWIQGEVSAHLSSEEGEVWSCKDTVSPWSPSGLIPMYEEIIHKL